MTFEIYFKRDGISPLVISEVDNFRTDENEVSFLNKGGEIIALVNKDSYECILRVE